MQVKEKTRSAAGTRNRAVLGQLSDMDLRLLKVFKSVVDCGGMAAAELELNIGTSTVSRHVKDLETRLGLVLCRRGRAGFALTAEGSACTTRRCACWPRSTPFAAASTTSTTAWAGSWRWRCSTRRPPTPKARIGEAIARFTEMAPEVSLNAARGLDQRHRAGVMEGNFQIGIIPAHRSSKSLVYADLFDETMLLYCGAGHALFDASHAKLTWAKLREHHFAGLGYHSPNMELSHRAKLSRKATGFDQEAIATLILSGRNPRVLARPLRAGLRAARAHEAGAAGALQLRVPVRELAAQVTEAVAGGAGVPGVPGAGAPASVALVLRP
jgi:DNA-binding transcriptional LysR family regulator